MMDRITEGYMRSFATSQEIAIDKDLSILFEKFACYCVLAKEYGETFDLSDVATGGGNDGGLDGVAIIANGVLVTSVEEFDDILENGKSVSELKFVVVQAKTSSAFSGSDIATFGFGARDLFKEEPELVQNTAIKEKTEIISHILSNMIHVRNKPQCLLYYVTLGQWCDDKNVIARIESVKNDLIFDNLFSFVEFYPVDIDMLQKMYKATIEKIQREIDFSDRIILPEMVNVSEAYLGILPANQFISLVSNDDGIIKSIFYDNVRDFQGDNGVNTEIADTLKSVNADKFVILNNGVTIICRELRNVVRNRFLLTDYQIVNGCQTSHVLFNNRESMPDFVFVSIKIIATTDEETVNSIIKATNRQTEVSDEQLLALSDFQKKLEAYYATYPPESRLYYERRSKQYSNTTNIEKVRIVTIATQIKSYASMFLDKPYLASRYYGRLLKDIGGLFDIHHSLIPYYTSAFALYKIDYLIRNKQIDQIVNRYRFHVLMMIKYMVLNSKKQPQPNSHEIDRLCKSILIILNDTDKLIKYINRSIALLRSIVPNMDDSEGAKTMTVVEGVKRVLGQNV